MTPSSVGHEGGLRFCGFWFMGRFFAWEGLRGFCISLEAQGYLTVFRVR